MKPPHSFQHFVEHVRGDTMLHHLKDPELLRRSPELSDYGGAVRVGQIDDGDDAGGGAGGGGAVWLWVWVDEDAGDFCGAGVDEALDAGLGVVEGLEAQFEP